MILKILNFTHGNVVVVFLWVCFLRGFVLAMLLKGILYFLVKLGTYFAEKNFLVVELYVSRYWYTTQQTHLAIQVKTNY